MRFRSLTSVGSFGLLAALAEVALRLGSVPTYIFPTPSSITFDILSNSRSLLYHVGITGYVALCGLLLGGVAALLVAMLLTHVALLRRIFFPILIGLQAVPLVAVAPFFVIWFGSGLLPRVLLAALVVYFPAVIIILNALLSVRSEADKVLDTLRASRFERLRYVYIPMSIPAFASAAQVTASLAIIGAIVAELSGSASGIGFVIIQASYNFNTPRLFSSLIAAAVASYLIYSGVRFASRRVEERFGFQYAAN